MMTPIKMRMDKSSNNKEIVIYKKFKLWFLANVGLLLFFSIIFIIFSAFGEVPKSEGVKDICNLCKYACSTLIGSIAGSTVGKLV